MDYFKECTTIDEAKNLMRKLAFELHPDTSGVTDDKEYIKMRIQYEKLELKDFFGKVVKTDIEETDKQNSYFDNLENVIITYVGSFIWLEGDTYNNRDKIKAISIEGMNPARYASKKKAWYFSPIDYKKKGKKSLGLNEIKDLYGSKQFKAKPQYKLS